MAFCDWQWGWCHSTKRYQLCNECKYFMDVPFRHRNECQVSHEKYINILRSYFPFVAVTIKWIWVICIQISISDRRKVFSASVSLTNAIYNRGTLGENFFFALSGNFKLVWVKPFLSLLLKYFSQFIWHNRW